MQRLAVAALLALPCGLAFAQPTAPAPPPKLWDVPEEPKVVEAEGIPDGNFIRLGRLAIVLADSPIADVAAATGAPLSHAGDGAASLDWVCLHIDGPAADMRVWLTSDEVSGDRVSDVVLAQLPVLAAAEAGCPAIKPEQTPVLLPGDLHLGMKEAEVRQRLRRPSYDRDGTLAYMRSFVMPSPSPPGPCRLSLGLWLKLDAGVVTSLSLGRSSYC